MAVVRGLDLLIYAGEVKVGGQRNCTISMSSEVLDASDKTTGGWTVSLAGAKSFEASLDGVIILSDAGYKAIVDAFMNGTEVTVVLKNTEMSIHYSGKAYVTSFEIGADYSDIATYSVQLSGAGALENKVIAG